MCRGYLEHLDDLNFLNKLIMENLISALLRIEKQKQSPVHHNMVSL